MCPFDFVGFVGPQKRRRNRCCWVWWGCMVGFVGQSEITSTFIWWWIDAWWLHLLLLVWWWWREGWKVALVVVLLDPWGERTRETAWEEEEKEKWVERGFGRYEGWQKWRRFDKRLDLRGFAGLLLRIDLSLRQAHAKRHSRPPFLILILTQPNPISLLFSSLLLSAYCVGFYRWSGRFHHLGSAPSNEFCTCLTWVVVGLMAVIVFLFKRINVQHSHGAGRAALQQ